MIRKWQQSIIDKRNRYLASKPRPQNISVYSETKKLGEYLAELRALRLNGVNKIIRLKEQIDDIRLNKQIDKETKTKEIAKLERQIQKAKKIAKKHKSAIKVIQKDALKASHEKFQEEWKSINFDNANKAIKIKDKCAHQLEEARVIHENHVKRIKTSSFKSKKERNIELQSEYNAYSSVRNGLINNRNSEIMQLKQENYGAYLAKHNYDTAVRNGRVGFCDWWQGKFQYLRANFDFKQWITKYALYFIVIIIFAILAIVSATRGVNLLSGKSITSALTITAPKIFYSLGVACLILLGGTDLSIGRLTGIGVSFSLMALSSSTYTDNFGHTWLTIQSAPGAIRVIVAILLSVSICTLFSAFSGFFSAKFKIHPFITTLATQLISYGFFQVFWSATSTFGPDPVKDTHLMEVLGSHNNWQVVLYAIIAIFVVWFIWNKTKFGKNLYAVGGNQEAAKVSGINPFIVTLLAFVMAGILYGLGGFVQAVQMPTGNFTTGYGSETDAIAACVIGGISFTGGIGKVSGAVIGTIVLGFLTFAFSSIGLDANLQLVIKGLIILAAVSLDCVKYIKRK